MSSDSIQQLIRIPVFPSCPLVSHGRKHRSHGMIGVSGHPTFRSKRKHDVRPKLPYVLDEVSHDFVEINPMQLPVRIIENHAAINAQNFARRRKLLSANSRQFVIAFRQPTMRAGLPGGQADHIDFGAALVIKPQAPAKSSRFVIRMRGNAKYAWHPKIVSEVRVGADASSAQPSEPRLLEYRQPAESQQTEKTDTAARAPDRPNVGISTPSTKKTGLMRTPASGPTWLLPLREFLLLPLVPA